jgi:hypothetical protein
MSKEEQILAISGSRQYFDVFCITVDENYMVPWHVDILTRKLQEVYERVKNNETVRLIIDMPPRHGKSETATKKFPAWVLGKSPDFPIIVTSYSQDLATDFGRQTRDIMNSGNYQSVFDTRLTPDQKAKAKWVTEKGGGYTAAGIEGSITGRGFKIGIIDDPFKNRQDAETLLMRDKVWTFYKSVFTTRQEGTGNAIIVINTRWHKDDLVGRLLEKQAEDEANHEEYYDKWEILKFPAIAEEDEFIDGEQTRESGDPLWPEKYPLAKLLSIKNTVGLYEWTAQYQQEPISSETKEFSKEWFDYYNEQRDIKNKVLKSHTLVDLAISEKTKADNSVVRTISKCPTEPNIYLREETAGKMDPLQVIDAIFWHYEAYRGDVWIEGVGYQRALEKFLLEEMKKRGIYFTVKILKRNNSVSKGERIRGLIPYYKSKTIKHRDDGSDTPLERELVEFPQSKKDDRMDCLANFIEAVSVTVDDKKKKKPATIHRPLSDVFGG